MRLQTPEHPIPEKEHLLQVRITERLNRKLRSIAGAKGISATALIREIMTAYIEAVESDEANLKNKVSRAS
jgi:hypothetical protein